MMQKLHKVTSEGFTQLIILLLLTCVIAVTCWVINRKLQEAKIPTATIFANVSKAIKQKYPDMVFDHVGWPAEGGIGIPLAAAGFPFKVSSENMPSLEFQGAANSEQESPFAEHPECDESVAIKLQSQHCQTIFNDFNPTAAEDARPIVDAELLKDGFKKQTAHTIKDQNDTTIITQQYTSGSRGCVYADRAYVVFSCYDPATIHRTANTLKPYVNEYQKTYKPTKTTYYGPLVTRSKNPGTIKASYTKGYDIAEMVVVDGTIRKIAFFYNYNDGDWHFVDQTDDELGLDCNKLKQNFEQRKAFYNQICQGPDGAMRLDSSQP